MASLEHFEAIGACSVFLRVPPNLDICNEYLRVSGGLDSCKESLRHVIIAGHVAPIPLSRIPTSIARLLESLTPK